MHQQTTTPARRGQQTEDTTWPASGLPSPSYGESNPLPDSPDPGARSRRAGLGPTWKITQPPPYEDDAERHALPLLDRWQQQRVAASLVPSEAVAGCLRWLAFGAQEVRVVRRHGSGKVGYAGLQTCGSVWHCPICAERISAARRAEMTEALEEARRRGLNVYLLTLTVRHRRGDALADLADKLQRAFRALVNRKTWRRLADAWLLDGRAKALEVTVGGSNGWHVHYHVLLICDEEIPAGDLDTLRASWADACTAQGLARPNDHGVDLRGGADAASYVAKWGLSEEVTKATDKGAGGRNVTPWHLLRLVAANREQGEVGELRRAALRTRYGAWLVDNAEQLWREYARAMKGRNQLQWSKGLREWLGLAMSKTDAAIAAEEEGETGETLARIDGPLWATICGMEWRGYILRAFNQGDDAGRALLRQIAALPCGPPGSGIAS